MINRVGVSGMLTHNRQKRRMNKKTESREEKRLDKYLKGGGVESNLGRRRS